MSGIFGYIGNDEHILKIKNGLSSLHRRGGKCVGITLKCGGELYYASSVCAQPSSVEDCTVALAVTSDNIGEPACNNLYSVVCDGYIDNMLELSRRKDFNLGEGRVDNIILNLLSANSKPDKIALTEGINYKLHGNPTYAFITKDENAIYVSKGNEPLVIGISQDGTYIASELIALFDTCDRYISLNDGDIARIAAGKISVYDLKGRKAKRSVQPIPSSIYVENSYKPQDEILYCPLAIKEIYNKLVRDGKLCFDRLRLSRHTLDRTKRIILTGSASSFNAAMASAYNFELLTDIETIALASNELMNTAGILDKDTIVVAVSSRGEDMETISAVKRAKYNGARTIAITSNKCSYLAMLCDSIIDAECDFPKESISMKSFQAEYFVLSLLGVYIGFKRGYMTDIHMSVTLKIAQMLSGKISSAIKAVSNIDALADKIQSAQNIILTGYTVDYAVACELAEKMRALTEINAYAVRLDEIKFCKDMPVIVLISNEGFADLVARHLLEIEKGGANITICTTESIADLLCDFQSVTAFGDSVPLFNPITIASGLYRAALMSNATEELDEVS